MAGDRAQSGERNFASSTTVLRGGSITMLGTLIGGVLAFLAEIMIARMMGPSAYGHFSLAYVLARIASSVSIGGLGPAVLHYIPIYRSRGLLSEAAGTAIIAPFVPAVIGTVAAFVIFLSSDFLAVTVFDKPSSSIYFQLLAALVPIMSAGELIGLTTRGFGHSIYHVVVASLCPPAMLLAGLWIIGSLALPVAAVCGAVITAYAIALLVGVICLAHVIGPILTTTRPTLKAAELLNYAWPVLIATLLYNVIDWADILLLGFFVNSPEVGIYRACAQLLLIFNIVVFSINAGAAHLFPVLEGDDLRAERNDTFRLVSLLVFLISAPLFSIVALFNQPILSLLGERFVEGAAIFVVLAVGRLVRNGLGNSAFLLVFTGRQRIELLNAAAGAFVMIALGLALIPWLGLYGAAITSVLCEFVLGTVRAFQVRRLMAVDVPVKLLVRITATMAALTLLIGLILWFSGSGREIAPFTLLLFSVGTGLTQVAAIWFIGIPASDRKRLQLILTTAMRGAPASKDRSA